MEQKRDEFVNLHINASKKLFETQLEAHNIAVAATAGWDACKAECDKESADLKNENKKLRSIIKDLKSLHERGVR